MHAMRPRAGEWVSGGRAGRCDGDGGGDSVVTVGRGGRVGVVRGWLGRNVVCDIMSFTYSSACLPSLLWRGTGGCVAATVVEAGCDAIVLISRGV